MRKYKGLDFKKLDDYKQAIDDGFEYYFKEDAGNYPTDFYEIFLYKDLGTGNYNFADIVGTDYDLVKAELEKLEINDRTVYILHLCRILIKRIDKKFYKVYIEQLEDVNSGMKHECDLEYLMDLIVKEMNLNDIRRVE